MEAQRHNEQLSEIRNRLPRRDYLDLSKPRSERKHKPVYIHREYVNGEFEPIFGNKSHQENHHPTLDTKYVIEYIKQQIGDIFNELYFYPVFRNSYDTIAYVLTVALEDDVEYRLYEQPLLLLDEIFDECGYSRSIPDKVFLKEGVKHHGVRVIQYEPYVS